MPKAEVGSTKHLSNKMKSKGLQRLRWYCQVCERQMRDENGFKMHTQSESHVRQMLVVGEDPKKFINEYSNEFKKDFIQLLRTSHGEKPVQINHFYQEYIANKEHIHMNATKWPSLTEFAKFLGREGVCKVEETDKGIQIAWIDDSPDALKRREAVRRKEMQDKGDEEREQRMIREQIKRAKQAAGHRSDDEAEENPEDRELKREEGEKIKLSFGAKPAVAQQRDNADKNESQAKPSEASDGDAANEDIPAPGEAKESSAKVDKPAVGGISMKMGLKPQTKNVFAAAKKNALGGGPKKAPAFGQPKKMSEAERIMKEEMEKKRRRGGSGPGVSSNKRQKM